MKRIIGLFLLFSLILSGFCCAGRAEEYTFRYQFKDKDYSSRMYYDDSLFDGPSDVYRPELATASLSFEMASFGSADEKDYADKSRNAEDLLGKMGFSDFETNLFFREKPGTDSLGCCFARKQIGGRTMIACGIRGSNYGAEWASNLTVGTDTENGWHRGFKEASDIFLSSLQDYLSDKGIEGRIGLWMVGYSRAGAVCNLSAARMDEAIRDGEKLFGDGVELAREDVYAYCFEPPPVVRTEDTSYPRSEVFGNIFCILNANDPVPLLLRAFSFTRYGTDKVLYDRINDPDYNEHILKMNGFYEKMENFSELGRYLMDDFQMLRFVKGKLSSSPLYLHWPQGAYLELLFHHFTVYGIETVENYVAKIQQGARDIAGCLFQSGSAAASMTDLGIALIREAELSHSTDLLIEELLHYPSKFPQDFKHVLFRAFRSLQIDMDLQSVFSAAETVTEGIAKAANHDPDSSFLLTLVSFDNLSGFLQAHKAELCLAFLRSMDPNYTEDPVECGLEGKYLIVEISDGGADVTITRGGEEIVRFEQGVPEDTGSSIACGNHGTLYVFLPYSGEYTLRSSCEDVSIRLCDPSREQSDDFDFSLEEDGDSWMIHVSVPDS